MDLFAGLEIPNFGDPTIWVSLLTLVFLEIVLGVDNIIFISIISSKLPEHQQKNARNIGLLFAMVFRVILLLMIKWIIGLKDPIFSITLFGDQLDMSWKDIILLAGGAFLIVKSTLEIHHKMRDVEAKEASDTRKVTSALASVIVQIILVDLVFSLDSILTAVGLVENVLIMIIAVVVSIGVMMAFAGSISRIINKHPSLQMLALSFLVVIGVILVAEGIHQHINKSIIYSCLAFSLIVEMLNIRFRNKQEKVKKIYAEKDIENISK